MTTVDARGRSCPEPVLMTKKALLSNESSYTVLVDNRTAQQNVTRFATRAGYTVTATENGGDIELKLAK